MDSISIRRSIRKYKDKPVEKKKIDKLLRAGMQAPSAGNQQPWEFIVIENKDTLKKLSDVSPYAKLVADAPLALLLLGNDNELKYPQYWQQDMAASAENILLETVNLNLGGVWMGVAPEKDRMNFVKNLFDLNENIKPFAIIAIGYPDGQENKFIDRFDESRIHYEKY